MAQEKEKKDESFMIKLDCGQTKGVLSDFYRADYFQRNLYEQGEGK